MGKLRTIKPKLEEGQHVHSVTLSESQIDIFNILIEVKVTLIEKAKDADRRVSEYAEQCIRGNGLNPEDYTVNWEKKMIVRKDSLK